MILFGKTFDKTAKLFENKGRTHILEVLPMFDEIIILHNTSIFLERIRPNPFAYAEIKELYDAILSFNNLPAPVQSLMEDLKAQKIETLAVILLKNGISVDEKT